MDGNMISCFTLSSATRPSPYNFLKLFYTVVKLFYIVVKLFYIVVMNFETVMPTEKCQEICVPRARCDRGS